MENKRKTYIQNQRNKRRKFLIHIGIPYLIITTLIFLFGYDVSMFDEQKLIEFFPPFFFLLLIIVLVAIKKYKIVTICLNCGAEIKNVKKDCIIGKIDFLGTVDKTEYKNVKTTIKGKTVYPRGGYSMRNSIMEHTSESTYEVNQEVPIVKKHYVYNIEYRCKNCKEIFLNDRKESLEPLHINKS